MSRRDPIDRELQHHIAERVDRLVEEGWTRAAAEREARRLFGDVEEVSSRLHRLSHRRRRRRRLAAACEGLVRDLVLSVRQFRNHPVSSGAALAVMIIGIGMVTAVFGVVDGVLIRPLPFFEPERLVSVSERAEGRAQGVSPAAYLHWRDDTTDGLEGLTIIDQGDVELSVAGEPEVIRAAMVSHEFFALMGVELVRGRGFRADEDLPGTARVVVISHELWRDRLAADPDVLGTAINLRGEPSTIIAVAPEGFSFPQGALAWLPFGQDMALDRGMWGARFLDAVGRVRRGVPLATVQGEMGDSLRAASAQDDVDVLLTPLKTHVAGSVADGLRLLAVAVALVLVVACANVGNLLLSRAVSRRHELTLRAALGAGRARMVAGLISESLVLSLAAGLGGYLFGRWTLALMIRLAPQDLPRAVEIAVDARVALAAFGAALVTGIVAGLVPALHASTVDAAPALRQGAGTASRGRAEGGLQSTLVVAQVALTVVLLVVAGLLGRSFVAIVSQDPGFESHAVMTAHFGLPRYRYAEPHRQASFYAALTERVEAIPGVDRAAFIRNLPISRRSMTSPVVIEGVEPDDAWPRVQVTGVTPGYFETMRIARVRGRTFEQADVGSAVPRAVVSEAFVRAFFPDRDPIGRRVRTYFGRRDEFSEIVGVVGDVRHNSLRDDAPPIFYYLLPDMPAAGATLVARTDMPAAAAFAAIEAAVRQIDPEQPVSSFSSMDDLLARSVAQPRFYAYLLSGFASVAVALAMVGLYGVLANAVQRRRFEIGVRMALGADAARVRRLVLGKVLTLMGVGVCLGIIATAAVTRLLGGMLFAVSPGDPATLIAVLAVVATTGVVAAYPPIRRATRIDAVDVLRG